ncbi:MAG: hypothetical protein ACHQ50_01760 [Fimbriimonadales bacterium]
MANTNKASYDPSDPNYLSDLLTHLSNTSDPNYQANQKAYNQATGLDVNGRYQGYNAARYMLPAVYQQLAGQLGYYNGLQPMAQQNTSALLAQLSNPDTMAAQYRSQAQASAQSTLQSVLQRLKSGGAGIGATQGAQIASANQAATAGNQYQAQLDSPEGRAQRLNSILGLIAGQQPNFGNLSTLHGMEVGTPRNESGLQAIGQLAGSFAPYIGSGLQNLFKPPTSSQSPYDPFGYGPPPAGSQYTYDGYGNPIAVPNP